MVRVKERETQDVLRRQALFLLLRDSAWPPTIDQIAERLGVAEDVIYADLAQLQGPPYNDGRTLGRVCLRPGDYARIMAASKVEHLGIDYGKCTG